MIAIQSQDKQLWEGDHIGHGINKDEPVIYYQGYVVGRYDSVQQREYVLDQIAQAIADGKTLYRMPSVGETDIALRPCGECRYDTNDYVCHPKCNGCSPKKSNWQPIEQKE